jgi:hypothetical protein
MVSNCEAQIDCGRQDSYYILKKDKNITCTCDSLLIYTPQQFRTMAAKVIRADTLLALYEPLTADLTAQNNMLKELNQKHKTYIDSLEVYNKFYAAKINEQNELLHKSVNLTDQAVKKAKLFRGLTYAGMIVITTMCIVTIVK